jgi:hypothetical protein
MWPCPVDGMSEFRYQDRGYLGIASLDAFEEARACSFIVNTVTVAMMTL